MTLALNLLLVLTFSAPKVGRKFDKLPYCPYLIKIWSKLHMFLEHARLWEQIVSAPRRIVSVVFWSKLKPVCQDCQAIELDKGDAGYKSDTRHKFILAYLGLLNKASSVLHSIRDFLQAKHLANPPSPLGPLCLRLLP
jgi:hypothetical protein